MGCFYRLVSSPEALDAILWVVWPIYLCRPTLVDRGVGADGASEFRLQCMHDTPGAIADILSEPMENKLGTSILWEPGKSRVLTTKIGVKLVLSHGSNSLGWLRMREIKDPKVIDALLAKWNGVEAALPGSNGNPDRFDSVLP